jgi:hypothetical protein
MIHFSNSKHLRYAPDALPAQTNLNLPPNAQFHFCPAKSRLKGTLYHLQFRTFTCGKFGSTEGSDINPHPSVTSPTEPSKPLKTISLPITPNPKLLKSVFSLCRFKMCKHNGTSNQQYFAAIFVPT